MHKHKWEYERHNSLILRSCDCGIVEEGTIIEEPQLISIAPTDLRLVKDWKRI